MTLNRKPRVFIGCSREAIPYAEAVAGQLEHHVEVNAWWAETFGANDYTMESLDRELDSNDFAIFIFAAEDIAIIRDKKYLITRDNTLFEMGLFWGRLGRRRTFCLVPNDIPQMGEDGPTDFHLPSDLDGINLLRYTGSSKKNNAVITPCARIKAVIQEVRLFQQRHEIRGLVEMKQSILEFFWELFKHASLPDDQRYTAYAEAVRNSIIPPPGFRTRGAALWKRVDEEYIGQVGGNVGKGRTFHIKANEGKPEGEHIIVLRVFGTDDWRFFRRREIADVYVLCYPLGKHHVLSVHFQGRQEGGNAEELMRDTVAVNDELLETIRTLVGGDSQ